MAYHTRDYGATWQRIVDEKDVMGHTMSIVQDPEVPNLLWLGTDYGLYFSIDYGKNWTKWTEGFPSTTVADLKIHPREKDLIIGTFGRAAWILDDTRPIQEVAKTNGAVLDTAFAAFPSPDAYLHARKSYQGIRFYAQGEFVGEDRPSGALLTLWVKPTANDADLEEDPDREVEQETENPKSRRAAEKVKIQVLTSTGDTIRTFTRKLKSGFNRFTWDLRRDGVVFPNRRPEKPDEDRPSGTSVMPGTYTLLFTYGDKTASTQVTVHADPRIDYAPGTWENRAKASAELADIVRAATAGFRQLGDMRKTTELVEQSLVHSPDSIQAEIKNLGKALRDSIAKLEECYMEPTEVKGIQRNPDNLNSSLWNATRYIRGINGTPSQMVRLTLDRARSHTQEVLDQINSFRDTDFAAYRQRVEALTLPLFKDLEPLKLE